MDREQLRKKLNDVGVPSSYYNLYGDPSPDDCYTINRRSDNTWEIYYSERGQKLNMRIFTEESDALEYLFECLKPDERHRFPAYLPLGSVVTLNSAEQEILIVSRALNVKDEKGKMWFFDYGGVAYPFGLINGELAYFQRETISKVLHIGYSDSKEEQTVKLLIEFEKQHPDIPRGDLGKWGK